MKIIITERQFKRILREQLEKSDRHYHILDKISDHVEIPYFKSMEGLTIYDKDDQEYIMEKILGNIYIKGRQIFYYGNKIYNKIYWEDSDGWVKYEYDDKGNQIYQEHSNGWWQKKEYDDNGNLIYKETSDGFWEKREYDDYDNMLYYEDSDGYIEYNR